MNAAATSAQEGVTVESKWLWEHGLPLSHTSMLLTFGVAFQPCLRAATVPPQTDLQRARQQITKGGSACLKQDSASLPGRLPSLSIHSGNVLCERGFPFSGLAGEENSVGLLTSMEFPETHSALASCAKPASSPISTKHRLLQEEMPADLGPDTMDLFSKTCSSAPTCWRPQFIFLAPFSK